MSIAELKETAIRQFAIKVAATYDEKMLEAIINLLNNFETGDKTGIDLSKHYDAIKAKYGSTLKKLAE